MTKPLSAEETESITLPLWLWKEKKARIAELEGLLRKALFEYEAHFAETNSVALTDETVERICAALGGISDE